MTDREWADELHSQVGDLLYCLDAMGSGVFSDHMLSDVRTVSLRLFKRYKKEVQKLDYETGRPL